MKTILAVVGLPGAGKTETANYINKKTGWPKVYFGQAVLDAVLAKGQSLGEANERAVREAIRAEHGPAAFAIVNLPAIKRAYETSNVILESMYSWDEYKFLKQEFGDAFKVLAIYSSLETRVKRMAVRPERPLMRADLESRDAAQIENIHQAGPIARADWTIVNEGTLEQLYSNIDQTLKFINAG